MEMLYPAIETGGAWLRMFLNDMNSWIGRLENWRIGGFEDWMIGFEPEEEFGVGCRLDGENQVKQVLIYPEMSYSIPLGHHIEHQITEILLHQSMYRLSSELIHITKNLEILLVCHVKIRYWVREEPAEIQEKGSKGTSVLLSQITPAALVVSG